MIKAKMNRNGGKGCEKVPLKMAREVMVEGDWEEESCLGAPFFVPKDELLDGNLNKSE
jgi:hypothetical protein